MPAWPRDLCDIVIDEYNLRQAEDVRRSEFDDGAIRQTKINSRSLLIRDFQIAVKLSNLDAFRTWLRENGHGFFDFHDWWENSDQAGAFSLTVKQARIIGGAGSVQFALSNQFLDGERVFTADVSLEGYE